MTSQLIKWGACNIYICNLQRDLPITADKKKKKKRKKECNSITIDKQRHQTGLDASTLGWSITSAGSDFHSGIVVA